MNKKTHGAWKREFLSVLPVLLTTAMTIALLPAFAAAETITWNGGPLARDPLSWSDNSLFLFPSLTGNIVTVFGGVTDTDNNVTSNIVIVNSGTIDNVAGGATAGTGQISSNTVSISGGTVRENVYGGFGGNNGSVTNNIVTISGGAVDGIVYGGKNSGGSGDLFTGNTLQKNASVTLTTVGNFETVYFGYSGDANIDTLDTTPTGALASPPVKLNTSGQRVNFRGSLTGTGGIEKQGTGTLTLSGPNNYTGGTTVSEGILVFRSAPPASGAVTVSSGAHVRNSTGGDITVNGQTVASGETFPATEQAQPGDGGGGSGCDAGTGAGVLALISALTLLLGKRSRRF